MSLQSAESRMNRIVQSESVIREEMFKDFTFKPQIKSLPSSYGVPPKDRDTPFNERMLNWQKERDMEKRQRCEMACKSEEVICTFHPRINKSSDKAVRDLRGGSSEPASERLYKTTDLLQSQKQKFVEVERFFPTFFCFCRGFFFSNFPFFPKKIFQDQLQKERESEERECTFKPQLSTSKKAFGFVMPKYDCRNSSPVKP